MPETLNSQLSDLAGYARGSASLPQAAVLRTRGIRRGRRRRGAAALLGAGVLAVGIGATLAAAGTSPPSTAGTSPPSTASPPITHAILTADQVAVLRKANLTAAQISALARAGFSPAQISALARMGLSSAQIGVRAARLTPAQAAARTAGLTAGQLAVVRGEDLSADQIRALARAKLTAAQLTVARRWADLSAAQRAALLKTGRQTGASLLCGSPQCG
jgi:GH24 family phage-related lysozyme (muramidase)